MKVSIEIMKWYSDHKQWKLPVGELVSKIGRQLGAVEETVDLSGKYDGTVVADILEVKEHPNADKLNIYIATDGESTVQVVSGDRLINVGDKVAWIKPGVTVPNTWGTDQPFVLEARPMRGEVSAGMFGSGKELDINDDHERVLILDTDQPAGTPFADAYHLHDAIIDIENKMFTHRPDGFGNLGVAREIAGIQGLPFVSPDWYSLDAELPKPTSHEFTVNLHNEIPKLVPRFVAVPIAGVAVAPSPLWLQSALHRLGIRPINNIVDITNYYMVVTGQPLHAYDYDKVKAATPGGKQASLTVRLPKPGEKITLLNGKEIEPYKDAMMVATDDTLLCVGGMIGGQSSEVSAATTNIILEAATWDMYSIRRTSMHHGIFTDAVTRFSKGQSPLQNVAVIAKVTEEIIAIAGGSVAGKPVDSNDVDAAAVARGNVHAPVVTTATFINSRLGTQFSAEEIAVILNNVECKVETHGDELIVTAPFWRTDIELPEDLVEEVGRLHGYDQLPHELPTRSTAAVKMSRTDGLKNRIRNILAAAGANELQTYSFVPAKLLQDVGQNKEHAFAIRNALSPDLQHYRLSLTPSLLEKIHPNIKVGYTQLALFELNKIHIKGDLDCDNLPREYQTVAFVFADAKQPGAAYYQAKYYLDYLLRELHVPYQIGVADPAPQWEIGRQVFAPFEPARSGFVTLGNDGEFAGFIGEYHAQARKNLKLPDYAAGFEIDLERLLKYQQTSVYRSLLKFPATEQDVCFRVKSSVAYGELAGLVSEALNTDERVRITVSPLDIYQRQDDANHKQITFRITLQHSERTLTTDEVNAQLDELVKKMSKKIDAERV